jgi:neutral ceramidase
MVLRAGFGAADITPVPGSRKIGWLVPIVSESVLDPIMARALVVERGGECLAVVQLDVLSLGRSAVREARRRVTERTGIPGECVMLAATHNHAGPAVTDSGEMDYDPGARERMVQGVVEAVCQARGNLCPAEMGCGRRFNFAVGHNRRVVMRDGTARTHGNFGDPEALCIEGPIDPEVAVVGFRRSSGGLMGALVNYACHPTHHGPDEYLSAGYPGVLAAEMQRRGCPVTLFLNGACGNVHTADPAAGGQDLSMEEAGRRLAVDAAAALEEMVFGGEAQLAAGQAEVELPFREATEDQIRGTARGAQRFVDPALYDRTMPQALERIQREGVERAYVQAMALGDAVLVGIPAEYFVEHGLRIKQETYPRRTLVVSHANGMVGYVPTRGAFLRGGYETTFMDGSRLAPEAGDLLADAAAELVRKVAG